MFRCAGCGAELFDTDAKFESGSGWPSFDRASAAGTIIERVDRSFGMARTEILCARCGGHLGHVFPDGPTDTGLRYCVNSLSLTYEPQSEAAGTDGTADSDLSPGRPCRLTSVSSSGARGGGRVALVVRERRRARGRR